MGAVELLKQAYYIDVRIDNKLEQMETLNALATKATTTFGNETHWPQRLPRRSGTSLSAVPVMSIKGKKPSAK